MRAAEPKMCNSLNNIVMRAAHKETVECTLGDNWVYYRILSDSYIGRAEQFHCKDKWKINGKKCVAVYTR